MSESYYGAGQNNPIRLDDNRMVVVAEYSDSGNLDAFGRVRTAEPFTLFDTQNQYNESPLFWDTITAGGGTFTHLPYESSVNLTCGTASGDSVIRQSRRYIRYQPGKSQLILMTGVLGAAKANVRQRIGYFDGNNGIFFEQTTAGISFVRRTNVTGTPTDTPTLQAQWNINKLDGSDSNGIELDTSKAMIFVFDIEWLGVGRVRAGIVIDGRIYYCHSFSFSNEQNSVYMTTANLPVRYEITNTGVAASSTSLKQICASVSSEGGVQERNVSFSVSNGATLRTVGTALFPVLSIRCGTAFPGGGTVLNRETIVPIRCDIFSEDATIYWQLLYNATITGANWQNVNTTHSGAQYDVSGSVVSGGLVIDGGYVTATASARTSELIEAASDLYLTLNAAGSVGDILTLAAQRVGNTNSDVGVAMTWKELY